MAIAKPRRLRPGDVVGVIAPSGVVDEARLDQLARGRMPKRVVPGSREWDVLYRRYYEEERRKLGR